MYDSFEKMKNTDHTRYQNDFAGRQHTQRNPSSETQLFYEDDKLLASIEKKDDDVQNISYTEMNHQKAYIVSTKGEEIKRQGLISDVTGNVYGGVDLKDLSKRDDFSLYSPYGFIYADCTDQNKVRFTGESLESATGLYHLGNGYRAYNPMLMRFLQPDGSSPFDGGGINPYAYCLGDPINFNDHSGHISDAAIVGITLGAIGLVASIFTFGLAAVAAGGIMAFMATASGIMAASSLVLEAAALGTYAAAVALEDSDPETSNKLYTASTVLGLGAFALGLGSLKGAPPLLGAFKRERIISGTLDSIDFIGQSGGKTQFLYSANYKGGSLLVTHGNRSEKLLKFINGQGLTGHKLAGSLPTFPGYNGTGPCPST